MTTFRCQCGKTHQFQEQNVGREVRCQCGQSITVPILDEGPQYTSGAKVDADDDFILVTPIPVNQQPVGNRNYGNHCLVRMFARGGMGQINIVRDENLKRDVALKELSESAAGRTALLQRFRDEAEITARLEHPGIVPVYSCGTDTKGRPYYTMKLVQGKTFQEAIQQYHALPEKNETKTAAFRDLLRRFASVCQTMGFAHEKRIIHRDLKPANIMLGEYGETLVMDWGLAKPFSDGGISTESDLATEKLHNRPDITEAGKAIGTPYYMSPEQASGDPLLMGPPSDIYSLGVILYQILTGQLPHTGKTSLEVIKKILRETPPSPSEVVKGVPKDLEAICLTAMAREPKERYKTATAIHQDLTNWLDDVPISVRKETHQDKVWRWVRKNTTLAATLLTTMFTLLFVLGVGGMVLQRAHLKTLTATMLADEMKRQAEEALELVVEKEEGLKAKEQELESLRKQYANLADESEERAVLQNRIATLTSEIGLLKTETEPSQPQSPQPQQRLQSQPLTVNEYNQIRKKYPELKFSENMADYNVIVLQELTDAELRRALVVAGGTTENDLIVARTTPNNNRIVLNGTEIAISINAGARGSVTLIGLGNQKLVLDAEKKSRVFKIDHGSEVALARLTITGGFANNKVFVDDESDGGGIFNRGQLMITDCVISENAAFVGGGIRNFGEMTISHCTISGNTCKGIGGGISNRGTSTITNSTVKMNTSGGSAGGINNADTLLLENTTISENTSSAMGGGLFNTSVVVILDCTISGNSASDAGGVFSEHVGTMTLTNSMISGNRAADGRGWGGGIYSCGTTTLTNCTISGNDAVTFGGGIYNLGTLTLNNTILAKNNTDIHSPVGNILGSNNLIGNGTAQIGKTSIRSGRNGNIIGTVTSPIDPLFVRLRPYTTWTPNLWKNWDLRLATGSRAINKGKNTLAIDANRKPLQTDLDGKPRIVNGTVDIGAYEYQENENSP